LFNYIQMVLVLRRPLNVTCQCCMTRCWSLRCWRWGRERRCRWPPASVRSCHSEACSHARPDRRTGGLQSRCLQLWSTRLHHPATTPRLAVLLSLGPFYGAIAVPSVTRCRWRCPCRRCRGHRCAGGVRQWRRATVATPGEWQCKTAGSGDMLLVMTSRCENSACSSEERRMATSARQPS